MHRTDGDTRYLVVTRHSVWVREREHFVRFCMLSRFACCEEFCHFFDGRSRSDVEIARVVERNVVRNVGRNLVRKEACEACCEEC